MYESMRGFPSSLFGELDGCSGNSTICSAAPAGREHSLGGTGYVSGDQHRQHADQRGDLRLRAWHRRVQGRDHTRPRRVDAVWRTPDDLPDTNDKVSVYSRERLGGSFRRAVNCPTMSTQST